MISIATAANINYSAPYQANRYEYIEDRSKEYQSKNVTLSSVCYYPEDSKDTLKTSIHIPMRELLQGLKIKSADRSSIIGIYLNDNNIAYYVEATRDAIPKYFEDYQLMLEYVKFDEDYEFVELNILNTYPAEKAFEKEQNLLDELESKKLFYNKLLVSERHISYYNGF